MQSVDLQLIFLNLSHFCICEREIFGAPDIVLSKEESWTRACNAAICIRIAAAQLRFIAEFAFFSAAIH